MDYSVYMIARAEYELRERSLISVPDYGVQTTSDQPGWMAQQAGRLVRVVGNALIYVGERMNLRTDPSLNVPRADHEVT